MVLLAFSVLLLSLDNLDLVTAFTAAVTSINNVGPGLNGVGPFKSLDGLSNLSLLVLIFDMLVGRLEIFPIIMLFSPSIWKKK
jgi:trk system potassium uptake protein TrkH